MVRLPDSRLKTQNSKFQGLRRDEPVSQAGYQGRSPWLVGGSAKLPEIAAAVTHLEGYMGSRPVRIGNAAQNHLQLDIFGEFMDSVYLYDKYGSPIGHDEWMNVVRLIDWVCDHWREKDESIWEVRGGRQEFLFSRVT